VNGAVWALVVLVALAVALVGVVALVDLLPRRRGDVDEATLRRARRGAGRNESPGPPPGSMGV
jgi:hypothetical protein